MDEHDKTEHLRYFTGIIWIDDLPGERFSLLADCWKAARKLITERWEPSIFMYSRMKKHLGELGAFRRVVGRFIMRPLERYERRGHCYAKSYRG